MYHDIQSLLKTGNLGISQKLSAIESVVPPTDEGDAIYLTRLADLWHYFYSTTFLFLQAAFLPVTQPFSTSKASLSVLHGLLLPVDVKVETLNIDLDQLILGSFKDEIIWPLREKLKESCQKKLQFESVEVQGRLTHLLSIMAQITDNEFERQLFIEILTEFIQANKKM